MNPFIFPFVFVCIAVIAAAIGVGIFLKNKGVFSRAAADAKATVEQGAVDAVNKAVDKVAGK